MFEEWQVRLVESERVARLGTLAADGRPHLVPVCYALLDGRFAIAVDEKPKRTTRLARLANLQRDSRATLLIDHYSEDWTELAWVRVEGRGEVLGAGEEWPEGLAALRARYPQYGTMKLEELPMIVVTVERVVGWQGG